MIVDQGLDGRAVVEPALPPAVDTEALIKEAKRRQRRRYARITLVVVIVGVVTLSLILVIGRGRRSPTGHTKGAPNGVLAVPRCVTSMVRVSDEGIAPGAGNAAALLLFRNISGRSCSMRGYPRIGAVTVSRTSVALQISYVKNTEGGGGGMRQSGSLPTSVLAAHDGEASFWIVGTPDDTLHCVDASRMLVTPPDGTGAAAVPNSGFKEWQWCGRIFVTPVLPGDSGTYPSVPLSYYFGDRTPPNFGTTSGTSPTSSTTIP
jgi:hypothetical protein